MSSDNGRIEDMPDVEGFSGQQNEQRERLRTGIGEMLALDQGTGIGYSFNALQIMSKMSINPEEWMAMTEYTDREIQIQSLRFARRHRARYGNSQLDKVDWKKAMMRVSKGRSGRGEIRDMFIAEKHRQAENQPSNFRRIGGQANNGDINPMRLSG